MPDITELVADRRTITVPGEHAVLTVTYRPTAFSVAVEEMLTQAQQDTSRIAVLLRVLEDLIVEWDLTRNGKPVPVKAETLRQLPNRLLARIFRAIVEDHAAGEAGDNSRGG